MSRHRLLLVRIALVGLALAAAGVLGPGGVRAEAPVAPAAAAAKPIPPAVVAKLLERIAADGRETALPAAIASALGLAADGETWPNRQFAVRTQSTGLVHAAAVGARPNSDLILSSRGDAAITIFRIHRDGVLAGAVYFFPATQTVAVAPSGEAAHDFGDERVFWQRTIEAIAEEP